MIKLHVLVINVTKHDVRRSNSDWDISIRLIYTEMQTMSQKCLHTCYVQNFRGAFGVQRMFVVASYCFNWVCMDTRYTFWLLECLKILMANFWRFLAYQQISKIHIFTSGA